MIKQLLFLCCFIPVCAFAQKVSINGRKGYRQLNWNDFNGKVDKRSPYTAVTHWFLGWHADDPVAAADGKLVYNPEVEVLFNDSWVNRKRDLSPELLKHEQGHFDIAVMCAAELERKIKATHFKAGNAHAVMAQLFDEAYDKCAALQDQYDAETGHGHSDHDAQQAEWNSRIAHELDQNKELFANKL